MSDEYKLTEEHFRKFKGYAEQWREKLGLYSWLIAYNFKTAKDISELDGNKAIAIMNRNGMTSQIVLNKIWETDKPDDEALNQCALHEMLELLLRPLLTLAEARFCVDNEDLEYETHRIIRTFENLLVGGNNAGYKLRGR